MPVSQKYLQALGDCLTYHQIIGAPTEVTTRNLAHRIMDFQANAGLRVDGICGPQTLWALQFPIVMEHPKLPLVTCKADYVQGIDGFESLGLRQDAANAYQAIHRNIISQGGVITTSGGLRSLSTEVNSHRSATSLHYTGLAFDLAVSSGSFEPDSDPFVISRHPDRERYWDVWCRAGEGSPISIEAIHHSGPWARITIRRKNIQGLFIDFSQACIDEGFFPISPRKGYLNRRMYMSSEWWHFQYESPLIENFSQFGIELLRIEGYTPSYIQEQSSNVWSNRKAIFGQNWI